MWIGVKRIFNIDVFNSRISLWSRQWLTIYPKLHDQVVQATQQSQHSTQKLSEHHQILPHCD